MIAAFCCACALLSIINTSPLHPTSSLGILSFASLASSLVIPFSFDLLQMSQLPIKSPKHCAKHGLNVDKLYKRLFYAFSTFLISVLSVVFLVWLILRPSKPEFHLKEADIYQLNLSGPHLLNTSIQITLVSKNPNQKGHEDRNLLTASLVGIGLPVAPSFGYEVGRDQTTGKLILSLKVNGRLRWKVGTWVSGRYRFNVECVAIMAFEPNAVSSPLSSKQGTQCSTSV
uniref:Late embryogenesis abundant protein LEA-2 subgroup domain-containing protein n=1 Tax=Nelumbo nucifera TaxID=4432 RepID=A0A822YPK1_NELNU|nr:TPA_asm: hypothetical protein HUJ06_006744 [Nelumbo nucifera]